MLGTFVGAASVILGSAYAYSHSGMFKKECDEIFGWIDRQIDWVCGTEKPEKPAGKPKAKKTKAAKPKSTKPKPKPKPVRIKPKPEEPES